VTVNGVFGTVTFDHAVCRTGPVTVADWVVDVSGDTTTYDDLGTSTPDCNADANNGVTTALLILAAAPPPGSVVYVTLTAPGGANLRDQGGQTVAAPQTHSAIATSPETTAPTIRSAFGEVGGTTIILGFSKDVYCTGFSFNASDIVVTDNNPATEDPLVTGMGSNGCGSTPVSADASFSITVNMALSPSRTYTVILTPEANEIQDTSDNDLANPSEISFTTAAADITPPTLIDSQLLSNLGTTDFGDVGDQFEATFSETMSASPFAGINVQDQDGSLASLSCGGQVQCTWNTAGTAINVTVTSALASLPGSTPGLQFPLLITTLNGFSDLQGNTPNLLGSPDRVIDNEVLTGPSAPPTVADSRMVSNFGTTDFGDPGDAFSVTFSGTMNLNPAGHLLLQDQDGTIVLINCSINTACDWNGIITVMTVTVIMPLAPSMGTTPGLQIPMRIVMMNGINSGMNGKVPDLANSADTLIDYE
jgi:hypothetical protein